MPHGKLTYCRGDIFWVELDPSKGTEARKTRACLILQNDLGNKQSSLTTVAPFLTTKNYPFVVNVTPTPLNGLDRERGLHLNQIRSVDFSRIKAQIGCIEDCYWKEIHQAIDIQLGFYP
jgi:mRNA interferase MazF